MYVTGELPEDHAKSLTVHVPKKAAAKKREEFRTISSPLSHTSKILTTFQRIEAKMEQTLSEDRFRFGKNRGTRETILALRTIIRKRIRKEE